MSQSLLALPAAEPVQTFIEVQLVYASPEKHWNQTIRLQAPATIAKAIALSAFAQEFPGIDITAVGTGIFGKVKGLAQEIQDQDRIEIYRPLSFDPKASRRRRAVHRQKVRNIKKKVPINDVTK